MCLHFFLLAAASLTISAMGGQTTPTSTATDSAAFSAKKASKKAAKLAAQEASKMSASLAAEAEADASEAVTKELAEKAARKAAKKAARLAEAAEAERMEAEQKAARKAAKKAAKAAALAGASTEADAEQADAVKPAVKRSRNAEGSDTDSTTASASQKRRKNADGGSVATKLLGSVAYRKAHQIVVDSACPEPMETFDAAASALGPVLTKALLAQNYAAPTPIQAQGWPVALSGQDVVAVAKTGSGKTCGFLLPALARIAERGPERRSGFKRGPAKPSVLVVAPTRELVQQIAGEAEKFASVVRARVVVLYGGVSKGEQVREAQQGADIVIATPGRLLDLAAGQPERGLEPTVTMENVSYLVLDEADKMLDMGFEPDIRKIAEQCKPSGKPEEGFGASGTLAGTKRQTLFFTATWPKAVQRTARSLTSGDALGVSIGQGADGDKLSANPMIKQTVLMIKPDEKATKVHEIIKQELGPGQTCVIFAKMKKTCDILEKEIKRNPLGYGFKPWCRVIHSDREQWERDETLNEFRTLTAGDSQQRGILVATDVAARGLDIPGVAMVVVYDFGRSANGDDGSVESYVHRIGRTGRAGKAGKAFAFFTEEDNGASQLIELLQGAGQEVPAALKALADAEWYKQMEANNKKDWYRRGGKGGKSKGKGKGKFGKGGSKGGAKGFGGRGGGKGGNSSGGRGGGDFFDW